MYDVINSFVLLGKTIEAAVQSCKNAVLKISWKFIMKPTLAESFFINYQAFKPATAQD